MRHPDEGRDAELAPSKRRLAGLAKLSDSGRACLTGTGVSILTLFIALYGVVLLRTAWVADDAYITFRTIDNFTNGYGLTWNVSERVQAYTHPLWMFLVSGVYSYTREFFLTCICLSVIISILTVAVLVLGIGRSLPASLLAASVLILSKAFVDYSTSGLENPLTHLLLVLFCLVLFRYELDLRSFALLSFIAALGTLNRMDASLLFAPTLALGIVKLRRWKALAAMAAGFAPFFLWEMFSLVYYGFPFPNTAYAKLYTELSRSDLIGQGFYYLLDSVGNDPLTLLVIGAGLVIPIFDRSWRTASIAAGVFLSVAYCVGIGGDFMSGRFLAAPLLGSAILVSLIRFGPGRSSGIPAFAVVLLLARMSPHPPPLSGADFGQDYKIVDEMIDRNGISDERAFYYPVTGLLRAERGTPVPSPRHVWVDEAITVREEGPGVIVKNSIGFLGFAVGPKVHVIDELGLADALIARLPPTWRYKWRIGHFFRVVPDGYVETLSTGRNMIADPQLARYYDALSRITRGPLLESARFVEIVKMNLGWYDGLIARDAYRFPGQLRADLAQTQGSRTPSDGSVSPQTWTLPPTGIQIELGSTSHAGAIEVTIDNRHDYLIVFLLGDTVVSRQTLWGQTRKPSAEVVRRIDVPRGAARRGYDRIRVFPGTGYGDSKLEALRLIP